MLPGCFPSHAGRLPLCVDAARLVCKPVQDVVFNILGIHRRPHVIFLVIDEMRTKTSAKCSLFLYVGKLSDQPSSGRGTGLLV